MKINTLFIYFSGYDRFDYAQSAVNLGALGYLLKPVDEEELLNMLLQAKERFIEDRKNEKSREQVEDLVERDLNRKREDFLLNLINGLTASEMDLAKRTKDLKMVFESQYFVLMVFELDNYADIAQKLTVEEVENIKYELICIAKNTIESYSCYSSYFKLFNRLVVLCYVCKGREIFRLCSGFESHKTCIA